MTAPGPTDAARPGNARRRRALPPAVLHLTGAVVIPLCLAAGLVELARARGGNQLSWGYAVEWPVIAGYGVYLWIKLTRERSAAAGAGPVRVRPPSPQPAPSAPSVADDPGLAAWQAYLADLHATDPPGGPPPASRAGATRRSMQG